MKYCYPKTFWCWDEDCATNVVGWILGTGGRREINGGSPMPIECGTGSAHRSARKPSVINDTFENLSNSKNNHMRHSVPEIFWCVTTYTSNKGQSGS